MESAQQWLLATYRGLGIAARREPYGTWRGWRRGRTHVDLVAPRVRSLEAMMLAWSPGTGNRPVRGEVVLLPDVADSAAFAAWLPTARGKFVLISFPEPTCRPDTAWAGIPGRDVFERLRARRDTAQRAWQQRLARTGFAASGTGGSRLTRRLDQAGVAGILTSIWSQGYGSVRVFGTNTERVPAIAIGCEDYGLLARLAENRQGPVIEVTADAQVLPDAPTFNVIAEIPGTRLPNEYVLLSAHLDSWDGASGATDNGTGTVIMLEAMRLLKLAVPDPRRTILVGHWNSEEQGLNGSAAFAADNPRIVEGLQASFNQDNGTGRITSVSPAGLYLASGNLARWLSQMPGELTRGLTFGFPGGPSGGGSDNASFICSGAPGWGLGSEMMDYFSYTWHTTRDTYDKVAWDNVRSNATFVAMIAYLASEDPERVPRDRRTVLQGQGGQPGRWPTCPTAQRATPAPQ
jgi:carboxypeptidase Q